MRQCGRSAIRNAELRPGGLQGACLAIALGVCAPGWSDEATPEPTSEQVHEIVVTAQRRAERLQEVPISAQVLSGQSLTDQNQNSLEDLTQTLPAVHVGPSGATSDMYVRGIGSGGNQSFDQSVGLFIDDVYHGRSRVTQATFLDIDRIEVLKGPQSTFFGNNAIAGALSIHTRKPTDNVEGWASGLYGEFGQYAAEGALGGPISSAVGARLTVTANGSTGWIKNVITNGYVPDENNRAARLVFRFTGIEGLDTTLKTEITKHSESGAAFSGQPMQVVNCPPPAPITPTFAGPGCAQYLALGALPTGLGNNRTADDPDQGNDLSTFETALTIDYERWGHTFTSVSAFYNYHFNLNFGNDATPSTLLTTQAPEKYHQFSQEFRVASPTGGAVEYLLGAYLQMDRVDFGLENNYRFLNGVIPSIPSLAPLVPYLPLARNVTFSQGEHSYAGFGSVTWNATTRLKLSAGLRGSWVNKDYAQNLLYGTGTAAYGGFAQLPDSLMAPPGFFGQGIPGTRSGARSDQAWMPSARVQYQITPAAMAYFSYSRGFKAGGFNGTDTSGVAANVPFGPEHVSAYEGGLKSEFLRKALLLNIAAFRSDYDDLQVSINQLPAGGGPAALLVRNAASSRSQGIELETEWAAVPQFRIAVNLTYLDAYYIRYPNAGATIAQLFNGIQFQDLSGRPTEFAPRWSGTLRALYTAQLPGGVKLSGEITPYFSSSYYLHDSDDPFFQQGSYVRLDSRLTLAETGDRWSVDVIGKNLTDRVIVAALGGFYSASKQMPRNVAVQVRFQW